MFWEWKIPKKEKTVRACRERWRVCRYLRLPRDKILKRHAFLLKKYEIETFTAKKIYATPDLFKVNTIFYAVFYFLFNRIWLWLSVRQNCLKINIFDVRAHVHIVRSARTKYNKRLEVQTNIFFLKSKVRFLNIFNFYA